VIPCRTSIAVDPGIERDFGVLRPLGNGLVRAVVGHALLRQLNVAFGDNYEPTPFIQLSLRAIGCGIIVVTVFC